MDVKYINPFITSVRDLFTTMIKVPFSLGKPHLKTDAMPFYEISSVIGLSGSVTGSVVVNLSKPVAFQLVQGLTGEEVKELDDDCTDALGEIANMIAGGAKKDFPGEKNCISTPNIIIGKHRMIYPSGLPIICIPCETSSGRLSIDIAIKELAVPKPQPQQAATV